MHVAQADPDVQLIFEILQKTDTGLDWGASSEPNIELITEEVPGDYLGWASRGKNGGGVVQIEDDVPFPRWIILLHEFSHLAGTKHNQNSDCSVLEAKIKTCAITWAMVLDEAVSERGWNPVCIWLESDRLIWEKARGEMKWPDCSKEWKAAFRIKKNAGRY
jgi:hypothetical protein